jgi:hypothetical protein
MQKMGVIDCDTENNMNDRGRGSYDRGTAVHVLSCQELAFSHHFPLPKSVSNEAKYGDVYLRETNILFIFWSKMYVVTIYIYQQLH